MFMKYSKELIGYYLYHLIEKKKCLSQSMFTFLEKEFVHDRSNERKHKNSPDMVEHVMHQ